MSVLFGAFEGNGVVVPHEATGGIVSFVEQSMAPRRLISGHVHEDTDVWVRVLEGRVGVRVGDEEAEGVRDPICSSHVGYRTPCGTRATNPTV